MRTYRYYKYEQGKKRTDCLAAVEEINPEHFIISEEMSETNKRFHIFNNFAEFEKAGLTGPYHEMIRGEQSQKLKFDIDAELSKMRECDIEDLPAPVKPDNSDPLFAEYLGPLEAEAYREACVKYFALNECQRKGQVIFDAVIAAIKSAFLTNYEIELTDEHIVICDSSNASKFSRHIIIDDFCVSNYREAKWFCSAVKSLLADNVKPFLDEAVNKSLSSLRMVNCAKLNSTRTKRVISDHDPISTYITQTSCCWPLPNFAVQVSAKPLNTPVTDTQIKAILDAAVTYTVGFKFSARVNNVLYFTRTSPSFCLICNREHTTDNSLFLSYYKGAVYAYCRRATVSKGENKGTLVAVIEPHRRPLPVVPIPAEYALTEYNEESVRDFDFAGADTLLVKSNMGTFKTTKLKEYIKTLPDTHPIIVISFRKSFTSHMMKDLSALGFTSYSDIKDPLINTDKYSRVTIQYESLNRLVYPANKKYLLVLDEVESILTQSEHRTDPLRDNHNHIMFESLTENCERLIVLDAFIGFRTFNLLKLFNRKVTAYVNKWSVPHDYVKYKSRAVIMSRIFERAKTAVTAPFAIAITDLGAANFIKQVCEKVAPDATIGIFDSESSKEKREELLDVNKYFAQYHILIYTSTVLAGVSFEKPHFKELYGLFSDKTVDVLGSIQMLGRIRQRESTHISIEASYNADLPESLEDIKKWLSVPQQLARLTKLNPDRSLPYTIDHFGTYRYYETPRLSIHAHNLLYSVYNANRYSEMFWANIKSIGGVVTTNDTAATDEQKKISAELKAFRTARKAGKAAAISMSWEITQAEANKLKAQRENITAAEKASLCLFDLKNFYNIAPDTQVSAEFVSTYNKPAVKAIYRNLNTISGVKSINSNLASALNDIDAANCTDYENASLNKFKQIIGVDIVNTVFSNFGVGFNKLINENVTRGKLEVGINTVIKKLAPHINALVLHFGLRIKNISEISNKEFRQKLDFVNALLERIFGAVIMRGKQDRHNSANDLYTLTCSDLFDFVNDRYEPKF